MNFISFTILFLAVAACAQATTLPVLARLSNADRADLRRRIVAAGGCNTNVCFAINANRLLPGGDSLAQKNLVLDVFSIIGVDDALEATVCEFGTACRMTRSFIRDFRRPRCPETRASHRKEPNIFLVDGISCCFSQLARMPGEANKIVLFADGGNTIGSSAIRRANVFRAILGGEVCAVGAGFTDNSELLAVAGGDPNKVFNVNSFSDVPQLQNLIEDLVAGICNLPSL